MYVEWDIFDDEDTYIEKENVEARQIDVYEDEGYGTVRSFMANVKNPNNVRVVYPSRSGKMLRPDLYTVYYNYELKDVVLYVKKWLQ